MIRSYRPAAMAAGACLLAFAGAGDGAWASSPEGEANLATTLATGPAAGPAPTTASSPAVASAPVGERLTLDAVLSMQTFGAAALSPDGRWLVYERRRPYDTAPRFDRGHRTGWTVSDLMVSATDRDAVPELLVPRTPEAGVLFGSWSPDSRRILVYRLTGDRLEAGVVTLADRSIRWTGLTPDLPITGSANAWLDDRRLALTILPEGDLPWMLRFDGSGAAEMDRRWAQTAEGRIPSRSRIETRDGYVATDAVAPVRQLIILDVVDGDRRTLAEGPIRDIAPSPDARRIAVLMSAGPAPSDPSGAVVQSAVQTRSRLTIVEVANGAATRPREPIDVAPNLLRWSPSGDAVLVWAREDDRSWCEADLIAIGLDGEPRVFDTGDLLPLPDGANIDELRIVQADWIGEDAVLRARRPGSDRLDWWRVGSGTPRALTATLSAPPATLAAASVDRVLAFADGRLWSIGSNGARAITSADRTLADGQSHTLMEAARLRANETPRRGWAIARSGMLTEIVDQSGATVVSGSGACGGYLQNRSAVPGAVVTACVDGGVETLRLLGPGGQRLLDQVNAGFAGIAMPAARPIRHQDARDRETTSYLFMPPDRPLERVKGLVVMVYPGVVDDGSYIDATGLGILGPRAEILAGAGYAVLSAALPSEEESPRSSMIDDFVRNTDLAVDATLEAVPGLPEDRMAVLGHSFGGYTALAIATRSRRYRSYVSWAGPTDPASKWGTIRPHGRIWPQYGTTLDWGPGAVQVGQARMGVPPWADIDAYAAASPYRLADRIQSPLLLITADRDYVPMTQAELMLTAMKQQGKWARLVTYWGEGHSNSSPANVRDVYQEIFDWLDRTLGPEGLNPATGAAPMFEPSPRSPPSP